MDIPTFYHCIPASGQIFEVSDLFKGLKKQ